MYYYLLMTSSSSTSLWDSSSPSSYSLWERVSSSVPLLCFLLASLEVEAFVLTSNLSSATTEEWEEVKAFFSLFFYLIWFLSFSDGALWKNLVYPSFLNERELLEQYGQWWGMIFCHISWIISFKAFYIIEVWWALSNVTELFPSHTWSNVIVIYFSSRLLILFPFFSN